MLVFGLGILGEAVYKMLHPVMPGVETMGVIGGLALIANLVCFALLYRHRGNNMNMSSMWLCSRNDLIANVGVLIASLFLGSALQVLSQSIHALRTSLTPIQQAVRPITICSEEPSLQE